MTHEELDALAAEIWSRPWLTTGTGIGEKYHMLYEQTCRLLNQWTVTPNPEQEADAIAETFKQYKLEDLIAGAGS